MSVISLTEIDSARTRAANLHRPMSNKYRLQTKKKIMTPSKCKFPVSSIIMKGFKRYKKIFFSGSFNLLRSFFPKNNVPKSAAIMRNLSPRILPKTLCLEK